MTMHQPCKESCPCWVRGATDEANIRNPRPGIRQLTGYIRALSDSKPGLDDEGMARAVARVFIPEETPGHPRLEGRVVTLDPDPLHPADFGEQVVLHSGLPGWMERGEPEPRSGAALIHVLVAVIAACVVGLAWVLIAVPWLTEHLK